MTSDELRAKEAAIKAKYPPGTPVTDMPEWLALIAQDRADDDLAEQSDAIKHRSDMNDGLDAHNKARREKGYGDQSMEEYAGPGKEPTPDHPIFAKMAEMWAKLTGGAPPKKGPDGKPIAPPKSYQERQREALDSAD
jgi:hypothetical protein